MRMRALHGGSGRVPLRNAFLLGVAGVWSASAAFLACGNSSGNGGGTDGGTDTTTMFDVQTDKGGPAVDHFDAGHDTGAPDSGLVGHCSAVNGPACDLVLQNCQPGYECVVVNTADAALGATTACVMKQASEHLAAGSPCCPNAPTNACDPGMTCVGTNCVDAAAPSGRCTPACCPSEGGPNTSNCGSSPEGYVGHCDLQLTNADGAVLYNVCTYENTCTALHVHPCATGYECLVSDNTGTSNCTIINGPGGSSTGAEAGATCQYANYCGDGMECITWGSSDAGQCSWLCYAGGPTPFDAGVLTSMPGYGGCPKGATCMPATSILPSWLGLCYPP